MSDDLNSLYDPWSREFGEYVIVFQGFDFYVCYRFLVSSLSFSKENSLYQNPAALPRLLFTSVNFDHTSHGKLKQSTQNASSRKKWTPLPPVFAPQLHPPSFNQTGSPHPAEARRAAAPAKRPTDRLPRRSEKNLLHFDGLSLGKIGNPKEPNSNVLVNT